jgi:DNA-binding response OmpR family regulator
VEPSSETGKSTAGFFYLEGNAMVAELKDTNTQSEVQPIGLDLDESLKRNKRVMIIDDDPDTVELLKRILRLADFDVASARNGVEAPVIAEKVEPDVILLDMMMPEIDGKETFRNLRKVTRAPIIVVSALSSKEMIVDLLNLGTDDYVTKPFHRDEIVARIHAVLRRSKQKSVFDGVSIPEIGFMISFSKREVQVNGTFVHLSPKEFNLVQLLAQNLPHVVQYDEIAREIWGETQSDVKNRIKYLVHLIRKKFSAINPDIEVIITVDRFGYRLRTE